MKIPREINRAKLARVQKPQKTGTLIMDGVLKPVAAHHRLSVEELLRELGLRTSAA